ncbi:MAG: chitin disaccharide deacetylase [Negativicutes bacterium]|nr:chitin disaccharide deacetylase [Negativicutes bacterium]
MKVIINADDFGLTPGVNEGIVRAMRYGVVTSTTWMANMPASAAALDLAGQHGISDIGQHLVLTCGRPVLPPGQVPSLVDDNGFFHRNLWRQGNEAEPGEVEREWRAQIARGRELGLVANHFDSHHHAHMLPRFAPVFIRLAAEAGVPVRLGDEPHRRQQPDRFMSYGELRRLAEEYRVKVPAMFASTFYGEGMTVEGLLGLVDEFLAAGQAAVEFMCHPAVVDEELLRISSYARPREMELAILTDSRLREQLIGRGCRLVGFGAFHSCSK